MAKADSDRTTWLLLRDAKARVVEVYQSSGVAERLLREWLETGQVRWRALRREGFKRPSDPDVGDPRFWGELSPRAAAGGARQVVLRINWDESSARRNGMTGYAVYRIEIAGEDLADLLPCIVATEKSAAPPTGKFTPTKVWIEDDLKSLRAANELSCNMGITAVARLLEKRMHKAVERGECAKPVGLGHIKNMLRERNLWPRK